MKYCIAAEVVKNGAFELIFLSLYAMSIRSVPDAAIAILFSPKFSPDAFYSVSKT